ncbi:Lipoxygenase-likey domain-containing protein 1 [Varanus komodoensis]|nr:Lipoxygenase-likey domain-containing protein 1 [Varanus komodoensis]
MYTNARSMANKQEELEALLGIGGYDLVGITETWWDERQVWNVNIEGYHLVRKDRKGKRGGGVTLYVREGIGCSEIECSTDGDSVEAVWMKLRGFDRERDLTVGVEINNIGNIYKIRIGHDGISKQPEWMLEKVYVYTGHLEQAGTDSSVYLCIYGKRGDSGLRLLHKSDKPKKFQKGMVSCPLFDDMSF